MSEQQTPLTLVGAVAPDLLGRSGKAWAIDLQAAAARTGKESDPRTSVTLPSWVVYAPYAHPIWGYYAILCVALRHVEGVPPAKVMLEGATHEVIVMALDPDFVPAVDAMPRYLWPANFCGQFIEPSDMAASARVRQAVQDVIDGTLNPDTDFRHMWIKRFSDSNIKKDAPKSGFVEVSQSGDVLVHGTGAGNIRTLQDMGVVVEEPKK